MITRQTVKSIRQELNEALRAIQNKHNINIEIGTIRFDNQSFRCKLSAQLRSATNLVNTMQIVQSTTMNPELMVGKRFKRKRTTYTVLKFLPNRPKFCYEVQTNTGKIWLVASNFFNSATEIK